MTSTLKYLVTELWSQLSRPRDLNTVVKRTYRAAVDLGKRTCEANTYLSYVTSRRGRNEGIYEHSSQLPNHM